MSRNLPLSVIVPVHEPDESFELCIAALRGLDQAADEILVVLDGEKGLRRAQEIVGPSPGNITLLVQPHKGPAEARNLGASRASGEILLFIDADVVVPRHLVAAVKESFADSSVDAVFGSYDALPKEPGFFSQFRNLLHHFVHQNGRTEASSFWTGCGALRARAFHAAGGFDPRYRDSSIEDVELGYRLRRMNARILLRRDLQVQHLKRWTPLEILRTDLLRRSIPWTRLILRTREFPDDLATSWSSRMSVVLAAAGAAAALAAPFAQGAAPFAPELLVVSGLSAGAFVATNARLFAFFASVRGLPFAAGGIAAYWVVALISAMGFALGTAASVFAGERIPAVHGRVPPCVALPGVEP